MSITALFQDGFDHYTSLASNYDSPGTDTAIDSSGTLSRTGLGCCKINTSAFGPLKTLSNQARLAVVGAFKTSVVPGSFAQCIRISDPNSGNVIILGYNPDFSMEIDQNGTHNFTTAPGILQPGTYNTIGFRVFIDTVLGSIQVWVNGTLVINQTGINTRQGLASTVNTFQLMVNGGSTLGLWDDVGAYMWTDPNADTFGFGPSMYPALPVSDSGIVNWTPATGTSHFPMVNSIPPDPTKYVFDGNVGDIDQYIHAIPGNQQVPPLPSNPIVIAIAHSLSAELDAAGTRDIASNKSGVQGATNFPLTTSYVLYQQPYTPGLNHLTDLATTPFGPEVTV